MFTVVDLDMRRGRKAGRKSTRLARVELKVIPPWEENLGDG